MNSEIRLPPEHCGAQGNMSLKKNTAYEIQKNDSQKNFDSVPASSIKENPVVFYSYSCLAYQVIFIKFTSVFCLL